VATPYNSFLKDARHQWRDKEQHVLLFSGQVTVMTLKIKTIFVHTNCFFLKCLISTPKLNRITIGPLCKY